ncbi:MAG: DUF5916 domain-containing protein [Gemmatimonadota bacterium]
MNLRHLLAGMMLIAGTLSGQSPATVRAVRTTTPVVLDGLDTDPIWQTITPTTGFHEVRPVEAGDPSQQTAFRVAYDATNLYLFVRSFDTAPDSIVGLLARRDEGTASDNVVVMLDSYHDRRTGFEFQVNAAGTKADHAIYNDGQEDTAWDAVWDVATSVDSLGWTAEYRIPFSQLGFAGGDDLTFGIAVWRSVQRDGTQASWPGHRPSRIGLVSQFGDLTGLTGLEALRRAEFVPYVLTQNEPAAGATVGTRRQALSVGGDVRYRLTSNFALNATVNPDFGQVEADPAELNLSAFETFFGERRPFFVAGAGVFDFKVNCFIVVDCRTGEGLFYSRRIGRAPTLAGINGDASTPTSSRILGAAKLTGRTPSGFSLGFLDAVTSRVGGLDDRTVEPATNYSVLRLNRDYRGGATSVGAMVTAVNRSLDQDSDPYLHGSAYTGGLDARHRIGNYEFSGSLMASRVAGTAEAIARTQQQPAHYYQRPDGDQVVDPDRTVLSGAATEFRFAKTAGLHTHFETGYGRQSAGFELNDIGFLRIAGEQSWNNWFQLGWNTPTPVYRRLTWNFNWWQHWSLDGLPTDRAFNTNTHIQLANRMWFHLGGTYSIGDTYCDRSCTRGGPALRVGPRFSPWGSIEGDDRHAIVPGIGFNYTTQDGGRSSNFSLNPSVRVKMGSRFSTSLSVNASTNRDDSQWFGNPVDGAGVTHYTFAALDQRTLGVTWRLNYTFSPTASLQWYANPFISKGTYSRVRELDDPRAVHYDDRFQEYTGSGAEAPGGFNVKAFRSNAVFRWEYRPGSTLFLVWSQGRSAFAPVQGEESFRGDFGDLFGQRAEDRFLVKVSYWLNR